MTREEAIAYWKQRSEHIHNWLEENKDADFVGEYVEAIDMAIESLQSDAEPIMTEEVREALMRLAMCAREECAMCKYKGECDYDFQYNISTDNMNSLADALLRSKCEVDAEWIPCSERLPLVGGEFLVTLVDNDGTWVSTAQWNMTFGGRWQDIFPNDGYRDISNVIAWMPLPEPYREDGEEE